MTKKVIKRHRHATTKRSVAKHAKKNGTAKHAKKRALKNGAYSPKVLAKILTTAQFMAEYHARLKRMPKTKRERLLKKVEEDSAQWI
jgi:hypothetical protein